MKKSLIALAVMAAAGAASAQSSVTLFGIVDATLQFGRGNVSDRNQLGNSGYNSSRLGFRGTEDLGGGMSASFWLEAGVNNDNGSGQATNTNNQASGNPIAGIAGGQGLTFNRRSTVSLAGNWGELRLGRDYTPHFWNLTVFDPFGTNGVGTTATLNTGFTGVTTVRASNSIGYFLPRNLGGFYGQVQYYMGENADPSAGGVEDDGSGLSLRVGFATGPFNVAFAYGKTEFAAGDIKQMNLAGQWDFGMAKLMGQIVRDENGATDADGWLIGALVPVGAGEIRLAYSTYKVDTAAADPKQRKIALGYVHNLSKRTAVYATYAQVKNSGGSAVGLNGAVTAANSSSRGLDIGIRHSF
ncbi:porin [Caenimonas sedimenti]|uniref:Porin n=1 Tax=Caenimonas sedimenti TaxID=2596921 RepID=A0A562ZI38_9BURK|nr:porin [Caenimonas sedimenti]TWO68260.1 porin [Caenimonas sedimenti]